MLHSNKSLLHSRRHKLELDGDLLRYGKDGKA